MPYLTCWLVLLLAPSACGWTDREAMEGPRVAAAEDAPRPVHVDSVFPIEEEIRRFRAGLGDPSVELSGGAADLDELVARFARALSAGEPAAFADLVISRAEFVDLYYPHTRFTAPPYEMSPQLLWFQLETAGGAGLARALSRYGGPSFRYIGYRCPEAPAREGPNRIWNGCLVRLAGESGDTVEVSLFGPILERNGRFEFITYANRL